VSLRLSLASAGDVERATVVVDFGWAPARFHIDDDDDTVSRAGCVFETSTGTKKSNCAALPTLLTESSAIPVAIARIM